MERMTHEQATAVVESERRQMSKQKAQVAAAVDLGLRQWCVDKAIAAIAAYSPGNWEIAPKSPEVIAQSIYDFVTDKKERP